MAAYRHVPSRPRNRVFLKVSALAGGRPLSGCIERLWWDASFGGFQSWRTAASVAVEISVCKYLCNPLQLGSANAMDFGRCS